MLPDLPSDLIRVALADLSRCEADPRYEVCMHDWHAVAPSPSNNICHVCMAGAVIAQTLGAAFGDDIVPSDYTGEVRNKLEALNEFRIGRVNVALNTLGLSSLGKFGKMNIVYYTAECSEQFHLEMNMLADDLEKEGL